MKPSQYNLIENHGERTLVMNAKTGAILSLDKRHADRMRRMVSSGEWGQTNCVKHYSREGCC